MTKQPLAIDLKRLRVDALKAREALPARGAAGTVAAVRAAMPAIKGMRDEGVPWAAIAAALAAQGVTQGTGDQVRPLTRSRLTALVSAHNKREEKLAVRGRERQTRSDLAPQRAEAPSRSKSKLSLASELAVKAADATPSGIDDEADEEAIRRGRYDAMQHFLKDE